MQTLTFPYRPKALVMAVLVMFCALLCAFMVNEAMTNEVGLIIDHLIELSPQHASWFYGFLAFCCGALALFGLAGLIAGLKTPRLITLTDSDLIAPKSLIGRTIVTVPLTSITGIEQQRVQRNDLLHIRHAGGRLTIALGSLQDKAARADFVQALTSRVAQS